MSTKKQPGIWTQCFLDSWILKSFLGRLLRQEFMSFSTNGLFVCFGPFEKPHCFWKNKTIYLCSFVSPDDDEEEQTCPLAFAEDMASTSVTPKLAQCLQEEEKESDSDSEGPIQYRDEEDEDEDDEDESRQSKQGTGGVKESPLLVLLGTAPLTLGKPSISELHTQQEWKQVPCSIVSSGCWKLVWRTLSPCYQAFVEGSHEKKSHWPNHFLFILETKF